MSTIGDRLREARGELSMAKAAVLVGISQQAWNLYEKNSSAPGAKLILRICQAFHVSADWLLGIPNPQATTTPHEIKAGANSAVAIGSNAQASVSFGEAPACAKCPYKKRLAKIEKMLGK